MKSIEILTLAEAKKIIEGAAKKAEEINRPMSIAVVDAGGHLLAQVRMDGATIGSIDICLNKAFTSKAFNMSTRDLGNNSQPGQQFYGIHVSNHERIMIFAGGVPIKHDREVIGAIGVSGGSGDEDQIVAEAGVKTFEDNFLKK